MNHLRHPSVKIRRKPSVCFLDTVVEKQYPANGSCKTAVLQSPVVHSDSSTTLSSIWDIEVEIMDLELDDTSRNLWQTNPKTRKEEKRAPIVHFRR